MKQRRPWRVIDNDHVVATFADPEKARKRAKQIANTFKRKVLLSYRIASSADWPYDVWIHPDKEIDEITMALTEAEAKEILAKRGD